MATVVHVTPLRNPATSWQQPKFRPGDLARARHDVEFCDGTKHTAGNIYPVWSDCLAYYNVCQDAYDLVGNQIKVA